MWLWLINRMCGSPLIRSLVRHGVLCGLSACMGHSHIAAHSRTLTICDITLGHVQYSVK